MNDMVRFYDRSAEELMTKAEHPSAPEASAFLARCGKLLIGGNETAAASGRSLEVINPATEEVIARVAHGDREDVSRAVLAARKAFEGGPWRKLSPAHRARHIYQLGDAIDAHADELALLETMDNGKPLKVCRSSDIPIAVEKLLTIRAGQRSWAALQRTPPSRESGTPTHCENPLALRH
jgi:acyl-CoA reductase-like NAD-dependent aldehyde dehydrogenase